MKEHVVVTERIRLETPAKDAIRYLQDIARLETYEPKVDRASVIPDSPTRGEYLARGRFAWLLPWSGRFSSRLTRTGFVSEMIGQSRGFHVRGGFEVRPRRGRSCEIRHWEAYRTPGLWGAWATRLLKRYLEHALKKELKNIRTGLRNG